MRRSGPEATDGPTEDLRPRSDRSSPEDPRSFLHRVPTGTPGALTSPFEIALHSSINQSLQGPRSVLPFSTIVFRVLLIPLSHFDRQIPCSKMAEAFFNNIGTKIESFFGGGDSLPWTDSEMIASCELEASGEKAAASGENSDGIMRLAWALVHSRNAPDVQRGIAMLEAQLAGVGAPMQKREILYLLAVGQFRAGEYARSRRLIDQALKISPDFRQASTLKKLVEDKIAKDGLVGVGLAAAAVGVVASGIAAAVIGGRRR